VTRDHGDNRDNPDPTWGDPSFDALREDSRERAAERNGTPALPTREPGDDFDAEGEPGHAAAKEAEHPGYRCRLLDGRRFLDSAVAPRWYVKDLLVADQLAMCCGSKKTLKTSLLIDLALSCATGTPFLGHFRTYSPLRVAFISGESGQWTIRETALRVGQAKGIDVASAKVWWDFRLPQLANLTDMDELTKGLEEHLIQLLIFDPVYLALLAGTDLSAANLFDTGPLLLRIAETCLRCGCTPLLCHHFRKNLREPHEPGDLEDIAYSGFQEAARQWWLINRREPYEPGSGEHKLWLSAGGSLGQGGCWAVDVAEGQLAEDFTGRRWEVTVTSANEARVEMAGKGDARKQEKGIAKDKSDDAAILNAVDFLRRPKMGPAAGKGKKKKAEPVPADPPTRSKLRTHSKVPRDRADRAIERLLAEGLLEEVPVGVWTGTGGKVKREFVGIRRKQPATAPTDLLTCQTDLSQVSESQQVSPG
jgi:hypothetical protein